MAHENWLVIGRGFAGWHAAKHNVSSSGGDLLPTTFWTGKVCPGYLAEAAEGALVYDAAHLEADDEQARAFTHHVYNGPMVAPELPPGTVRPLWQATRPYVKGEDCGSLGSVSVDIYADLLRAIPGMKVGFVRKGEVIWES